MAVGIGTTVSSSRTTVSTSSLIQNRYTMSQSTRIMAVGIGTTVSTSSLIQNRRNRYNSLQALSKPLYNVTKH